MFDSAQILGFIAAVVVLVIVPGPNTIVILSHSLGGGRAAGLATVLGVETGTLVHTAAAAFGLSALLSTSALAFDCVKYTGAGYLVFLGLRALRGRAEEGLSEPNARAPMSLTQAYGRAVLTNVLNPKVAMFFLALLPQFVRPERGHVVMQLLALGLIVSTIGLCFGSLLAILSGSLSRWLSRGSVGLWQQRVSGSLLLGLGVRLAFVRRG
ncbi:MAG: LysE family translocator [Thermoanaerobaculia bacterium]